MGQEKKIGSEIKPKREVEQHTHLITFTEVRQDTRNAVQQLMCSKNLMSDFKDSAIVIVVSKIFIIKMTFSTS